MTTTTQKLKGYKFTLEIDCDNIPLITGDIPNVECSIKKTTKLLTKSEAEKLFWDDWVSQKTKCIPIEIWFINEKKEVVKILRYEDD